MRRWRPHKPHLHIHDGVITKQNNTTTKKIFQTLQLSIHVHARTLKMQPNTYIYSFFFPYRVSHLRLLHLTYQHTDSELVCVWKHWLLRLSSYFLLRFFSHSSHSYTSHLVVFVLAWFSFFSSHSVHLFSFGYQCSRLDAPDERSVGAKNYYAWIEFTVFNNYTPSNVVIFSFNEFINVIFVFCCSSHFCRFCLEYVFNFHSEYLFVRYILCHSQAYEKNECGRRICFCSGYVVIC